LARALTLPRFPTFAAMVTAPFAMSSSFH
jgi:hypothetical protein